MEQVAAVMDLQAKIDGKLKTTDLKAILDDSGIRASRKKGTHFLAWCPKAFVDKTWRGNDGFKNANPNPL